MNDRILVVDDEPGCRDGLRRLLEAWGYRAETAASAEEALERIERGVPDAVLTDLVLPGMDGIELVRRVKRIEDVPVIVLSGQGTIQQAVEAIQLGAQDFLEKPVEPAKLGVLLERMAERRALLEENRRLRRELGDRGQFGHLRGISEAMRAVFHQIDKVAPSPLAVLVVGESGTGKELVARTVHDLSPRRRAEFVPLNCAAIPATLLESEIFGHERGAFTGALGRKIGCFEMAHGGTLFLDEIAEMDGALQAKLLRVLQEQRFRRVGGREVVEADVRVVAATNRDPAAAIAEGKLREDLYYRISAFTLRLPPLRDRDGDVPFLAEYLVEDYATRTGVAVPVFDPEAIARLESHPWPGNVRELKNCVERAIVLSGEGPIRPEHLTPEVLDVGRPADPIGRGDEDSTVTVPVGASMQQVEREMIERTLRHTGGNKTRAARMLGVSIKTMHNKVKKYGL